MVTTEQLRQLAVGEDVEVAWQVSDGDIERGEAMDCWKCPQALALNRAFAGMIAEVDPGEITLHEDLGDGEHGERMYRAATTPEISHFIQLVDDDEIAVPGRFTAVFRRAEDAVTIPIRWEPVRTW